MVRVGLGRRAFVEALVAFPFGGVALSAQTPSPPVVKVVAGSGRAGERHHQASGRRPHLRQGRDPGQRWRALHDRAADRAPRIRST